MTTTTFFLMIPLLLAQQITTTISTRAKTSSSMWYCALAAYGSHITWVTSNAFALWQVGAEFNNGITMRGIIAITWYAFWATIGNVLGQRLAIYLENRYHRINYYVETIARKILCACRGSYPR